MNFVSKTDIKAEKLRSIEVAILSIFKQFAFVSCPKQIFTIS